MVNKEEINVGKKIGIEYNLKVGTIFIKFYISSYDNPIARVDRCIEYILKEQNDKEFILKPKNLCHSHYPTYNQNSEVFEALETILERKEIGNLC